MIQKILFACLSILIPSSIIHAQSFYEGVYVSFYSECCGIDTKAFQLLQNSEKKYSKIIQKNIIYWGKEGEKLILYTSKELKSAHFQEFVKQVKEDIGSKYKLVRVNSFFEYDIQKSIFEVHIPPFELIRDQEKEWLDYCKVFETENRITLLKGSMINETYLLEDQDKRYEINLGSLSEERIKEFIVQSKKHLSKPADH